MAVRVICHWCLITYMSSMVAPFCCSRYAYRSHTVQVRHHGQGLSLP